jgi:hypothetical protein
MEATIKYDDLGDNEDGDGDKAERADLGQNLL